VFVGIPLLLAIAVIDPVFTIIAAVRVKS